MLPLFDKDLSFNSAGIELSNKFEKLLKEFIEENNCKQYNPIELQFVLDGAFRMQLDGLYLDHATDAYMDSGKSLN